MKTPIAKAVGVFFFVGGVLEVKVAAGWGCSWGAGVLALG